MLNVSKRSLVDTEFSVSTFGIENSNFLPSGKVAHSSLCMALGGLCSGQCGHRIRAGQRSLFSSFPSFLPSCHGSGDTWCHQPYNVLHPWLDMTGREVTPAVTPHLVPSQLEWLRPPLECHQTKCYV